MNTITDLKKIVTQNKRLLIIILTTSVVVSFIHYKNQTISESSHFMTSNGKFDAEYLKEMILFDNIDTVHFNLPSEELIKYNNILEDISIETYVGSNKFINFDILTIPKVQHDKLEIQNAILDLINHNKLTLSYREKILKPSNENLAYANKELKNYQSVLDSLSLSKSTKKYVRLEKRLSELQKEIIDIIYKKMNTGQHFLLSPISDFEIVKSPIILFVFLYLVLGGVVFILFANKKINQ